MGSAHIEIKNTCRICPKTTTSTLNLVPLSLLDATTNDFAPTSAVWVFGPLLENTNANLSSHLANTLAITLDAYPHWAGQINAVTSIDGITDNPENFPAHARRLGRIYSQWGGDGGDIADPGVEFISAVSTTKLEDLYPANRITNHPIWHQRENRLADFVPSTKLANPLATDNDIEKPRPLMGIQITNLSSGGFILAAVIAHPLADITSLTAFISDWGKVSRALLSQDAALPDLHAVFDPAQLDNQAAGDINCPTADPELINTAKSLPFHRYDWWTSAKSCPWRVNIPQVLQSQDLEPAGQTMPWSEWDLTAPVSNYLIHFSREQVEFLHEAANRDSETKLSRHDAILAHVWLCIIRARRIDAKSGPVHCNLVYGVRSSFGLKANFVGSPVLMMNIELSGTEAATHISSSETTARVQPVAQRIRDTLHKVANPTHVAAHLHSVAYEKWPQRIWQAFLGQQHILVTTWARAGLYNVDFGGLAPLIYAEGIVPDMDGLVMIKEAPPPTKSPVAASTSSWTDDGVDVSIRISTEAMNRLVQDPLLLPLYVV